MNEINFNENDISEYDAVSQQTVEKENQLKTFNGCLARATDDGKTDLVKKAKDFLHSGKANKKNLFDWIDTDADPWTLVDGS